MHVKGLGYQKQAAGYRGQEGQVTGLLTLFPQGGAKIAIIDNPGARFANTNFHFARR